MIIDLFRVMAAFGNFLSWTPEPGDHDGMTLFFPELAPLMVWFRRRLDVFKNRGEEGLTTAEWVVLVAAVVAMALAAGAVIAGKVASKSEDIDLG